jgi:hypothetical protein
MRAGPKVQVLFPKLRGARGEAQTGNPPLDLILSHTLLSNTRISSDHAELTVTLCICLTQPPRLTRGKATCLSLLLRTTCPTTQCQINSDNLLRSVCVLRFPVRTLREYELRHVKDLVNLKYANMASNLWNIFEMVTNTTTR